MKSPSLKRDVDAFLARAYLRERQHGKKYVDDTAAEAFVALGFGAMNFIVATRRAEALERVCPPKKKAGRVRALRLADGGLPEAVSQMKPSELIRKALPFVARGHATAIYAATHQAEAAGVEVSPAVYNCAERRIGRLSHHIRGYDRGPTTWRRLAVFNAAALSLEEEGL